MATSILLSIYTQRLIEMLPLKICHFIGTEFCLFMVTLKYKLYKLDLDLLF